MRFLPVVLLSVLPQCLMSCSTREKQNDHVNVLPCILTSRSTTYRTGEAPALKVSVTNTTGKDIYLISALDGSDVRWRMPYCYFTVEGPGEKLVQKRCGNLNRLSVEDFIPVKAGVTFNPYQKDNDDGFVRDYIISQPETFGRPGKYTIQFHYSTNSTDMSKFMDDAVMQEDTVGLTPLFNKVPKLELVSNEIELEFK